MKIVIVGATGTIGKRVTAALQKDHEVIKAGSKSADIQVNISSNESIENFYKQVGKFDALICAAGDAQFGPLASMKDAEKGAAIELGNGVRINAVGPDIVEESTAYFSYFPGHVPVTMSRVTQAYVKSVLGGQTGQLYKVL